MNARQSQTDVKSYIYSTTKVNNAYTDSGYTLGDETLYSAQYTGGSISDRGKFIYIMAYTFENFYTTTGSVGSTIVFYQVFYFQITGDSPEVTLTTVGEDSETVFTDRYYNKNVLITDNNSVNSHNKNVTVQIYAYDYTQDIYLSKYGGRNGIAMSELTSGNTYELTENAHFTIRLYYSYEIPSSTDIDSTSSRIKRTYYFTIDKQEIENVTANNVSLVSNSSSYSVVSELTRISTNQSIAVSWEEKNSGASTFAYYRYFPIYQSTFYPEDQELTSDILRSLLNLNSDLGSFLAVNYTLDLTTANNNWLRYYGNTLNLSRIASNYVLSSAGLYLFDVYDAAGNHTVEIFIIDNSTPTFALYTQSTSTYSLITSSYYISETSTLYWGNYKAIQISNFDSFRFDSITGVDDVELADIEKEVVQQYYILLEIVLRCQEEPAVPVKLVEQVADVFPFQVGIEGRREEVEALHQVGSLLEFPLAEMLAGGFQPQFPYQALYAVLPQRRGFHVHGILQVRQSLIAQCKKSILYALVDFRVAFVEHTDQSVDVGLFVFLFHFLFCSSRSASSRRPRSGLPASCPVRPSGPDQAVIRSKTVWIRRSTCGL